MIKLLTITLCKAKIEVDDTGKITRVPKQLQNFLNQPLTLLETSLQKTKYQSVKLEEIE